MEIIQGRNGKWNIEGGRFAYSSKEEAEHTYRHFIKVKETVDSLEAMPRWMRRLFDYRTDLAQNWFAFYAEGILEGVANPNAYAWIKFKKKWKKGRIKRWLPVAEGGPGSGFFGHAGRPGMVGGSSSDFGADARERVGANFTPVQSRDELPEYAKHLKIPPAWTDIKYNPDPNGDLLIVGKDSVGDPTYVYSKAYDDTQAAQKWGRVEEMAKKIDGLTQEILKVKNDPTNPESEAAACAYLIMKTGIRPGSEEDTGAKKQAYGATTLEGRHIKLQGDRVYMIFWAKSGVKQRLLVRDKELGEELLARKEKAGEKGKLYQTSDAKLLNFVGQLDGRGFLTKDFRTLYGTTSAEKFVAKMRPPKTMKEYNKACREVSKRVARLLGNTYRVAMQKYISPTVFAEWRAGLVE